MTDRIGIETTFARFTREEWNSLERGDFIFADHRFLSALEESGSIGGRTGWLPRIHYARNDKGRLDGVLLLFEKLNSYGEYIFDWAWANAYRSSGLAYYPKLTAAIPFTPATGPKFLIRPGADADTVRAALLESAREQLRDENASSLHLLFITPSEAAALETHDMKVRHSFQYHWNNNGYRDFQDFLSALKRKRRYEIKREREAASRLPVTIETLTGSALSAEHGRAMYDFYVSTTQKMGGIDYLNSRFFELVFETMKDSILFVLARGQQGNPLAGALNFHSGRTLFGRNWGTHEELKNLHFELCYYRTIDWAIANGIQLFEAGAQGEHKFSRGFMPKRTLSAHQITHPLFASAIERFIDEEKKEIDGYFKILAEHDPFKDTAENQSELR